MKKNNSKKNRKNKTSKKRKRSSVKIFIKSALVVIVLGYIATATYLYLNQRKLLYFPQPGVLNITAQTVEISRRRTMLRGWVVNEGMESAVIYFGGNAERPEASLDDFKYLFDHQSVYMINYRGYGESEGTPTEKDLYLDAVAIYDHIAQHHNHVSVIGRSLGSGIAAYLATERDVHRLILVSPYDCLANIAQDIYPIFPMQLMMKDRYDTAKKAPEITAPTLIIKAENDEVIPAESTDRLIEAFSPNILEVATVPVASHNDIQDYTQYYILLRDFVNSSE